MNVLSRISIQNFVCIVCRDHQVVRKRCEASSIFGKLPRKNRALPQDTLYFKLSTMSLHNVFDNGQA